MKKNLIIISSILALIILVGCASKPEPAPEPKAEPEVVVKDEPKMDTRYPSWFLSPPPNKDDEDYEEQKKHIFGLGMAKLANPSLSKQTATARARADIAYQVSSRVDAQLKDFAQQSGMDGNAQFMESIENVTKQTASVELTNAVTEEIFPAEDGTWYVMVSYPKDEFAAQVEEIFKRNEDAAFAEFKADEAFRKLEADLDNNPPRSNVEP